MNRIHGTLTSAELTASGSTRESTYVVVHTGVDYGVPSLYSIWVTWGGLRIGCLNTCYFNNKIRRQKAMKHCFLVSI